MVSTEAQPLPHIVSPTGASNNADACDLSNSVLRSPDRRTLSTLAKYPDLGTRRERKEKGGRGRERKREEKGKGVARLVPRLVIRTLL